MTAFAQQLLARVEKKTDVPDLEKTASPPVEKQVEWLSISRAAKRTGLSRDTIYRLYKAGFIVGDQPSPKKIHIDMASLQDHRRKSLKKGFWTAERRKRYNGKAGK